MTNVKKGIKGFIPGRTSWNSGKHLSKDHIKKIKETKKLRKIDNDDLMEIGKKYTIIEEAKPIEFKVGDTAYVKKYDPSRGMPGIFFLMLFFIFGAVAVLAGIGFANYANPHQIYSVFYNRTVTGQWEEVIANAYSNGVCKGAFIVNYLNESKINTTPTYYDCFDSRNRSGPIILKKPGIFAMFGN